MNERELILDSLIEILEKGAYTDRTLSDLLFKYGYLEARVKLPVEKARTALWLNHEYGATVRYAELDMFETLGEANIYSNIHTWDNNNKDGSEWDFHKNWAASIFDSADKAARRQ